MSLCAAFILSLFLSLASSAPFPNSTAPFPNSTASTTLNTVPLNGLPTTNLTLLHIGLGLGTQNYSCAATNSTPKATGALATLYDATTILSVPKNRASISGFASQAYESNSSLGLSTLGHHWFSADAVPTFDLEAAEPQRLFLSAEKVGTVQAPAGSAVEGSVAWLFLVDDGRGVSRGVREVYRVETAGGAAPEVCEKEGDVVVRYAAEYWFYG